MRDDTLEQPNEYRAVPSFATSNASDPAPMSDELTREHTPCQATPHATLEEQIISPCIPKNEREWWAHRTIIEHRTTIEALQQENAMLKGRVAELEGELERQAWTISPAMAQAKIDELQAKLDAMWKEQP